MFLSHGNGIVRQIRVGCKNPIGSSEQIFNSDSIRAIQILQNDSVPVENVDYGTDVRHGRLTHPLEGRGAWGPLRGWHVRGLKRDCKR